jgi:hypothetical protein
VAGFTVSRGSPKSVVSRSQEKTVYLTNRSPEAQQAEIHFGDQKWDGQVAARPTAQELIKAAQTQMSIFGKWKVRSEMIKDKVRLVEVLNKLSIGGHGEGRRKGGPSSPCSTNL